MDPADSSGSDVEKGQLEAPALQLPAEGHPALKHGRSTLSRKFLAAGLLVTFKVSPARMRASGTWPPVVQATAPRCWPPRA